MVTYHSSAGARVLERHSLNQLIFHGKPFMCLSRVSNSIFELALAILWQPFGYLICAARSILTACRGSIQHGLADVELVDWHRDNQSRSERRPRSLHGEPDHHILFGGAAQTKNGCRLITRLVGIPTRPGQHRIWPKMDTREFSTFRRCLMLPRLISASRKEITMHSRTSSGLPGRLHRTLFPHGRPDRAERAHLGS
jgi:hypothetical protein